MTSASEGIGRQYCIRRSLARDESGIAVVEFAFVVVFMIFLYLGSQQLADAIFANRKVTTTVRAVTDLTTQYSIITNNDLDIILNASAKILAPYDIDNAEIRISLISIDENKVATITWSKGLNTIGRHTGDVISLPDELVIANTFLVFGEVNYTHNPAVAGYSVGTLNLSDRLFMSPRVSARINLT